MNPLAAMKEKLMIKPVVEESERVAVVIKENQKPRKKEKQYKNEEQELEEPGKKILEEENEEQDNLEEENEEEPRRIKQVRQIIEFKNEGKFDKLAFKKRLEENTKLKVTIKPTIKEQQTDFLPATVLEEVNKPKKITAKKRIIIEPEDEEMVEVKVEPEEGKEDSDEEEIILKPKKKVIFEEVERQQTVIPIKVPKKKTRITSKVEKGIAVLGPETVVEIGDTDLRKRIPKKSPPVIIKVSSYYMNDREIFVNFINSLFEPYRQELLENKENISCDTIGKQSGDFSLLTHQKIVRDYMNLYTPYRGLLLYHGLGSGKTASSIGIAEGMKDSKQVIIMTPASLQPNYLDELKNAGDLLYKRNQFWEWISLEEYPEALKPMSAVLNLPQEYIRKNGGAFFINVSKPSNYEELKKNSEDQKKLEDQLNQMIQQKYKFINYNGLRAQRLAEMTSNFTKNIFDNSVVVIDEAHNLISRIVNKLKKEKPIPEEGIKRKKKPDDLISEAESLFGEHTPINLATKLYYMLLRAKNARIVLLSGTPVINYPNEFAILFNILRGYIKTWKFPLNIKTTNKVDKEYLQKLLLGEKTMDYLDYSPSSKILTITRNPFGFKNKIKKDAGYQGVTNIKKTESGTLDFDDDFTSEDDFERKVINILKKNDIEVVSQGVQLLNKKALPDNLDTFMTRYISDTDTKLKNVDALKRRILGLSSYFKSAQESLLPKYNKMLGVDYHIVRVPMSDTQFKIYESARREERELEGKKPKKTSDELFEEKTSTYRIFSRLYCNFVLPERPTPKSIKMNKRFQKMKDDMGKEYVYNKLKEQMKPGFDPILDQIENEEEKKEWEVKINTELYSYVQDVINAQKKGKKPSDKKLMNIIKDLQKVREIVTKTNKNTKRNEEELQDIGKKLEDFYLEQEQSLIESEYKPEENDTMTALLKQARKEELKQDIEDTREGEIEGDEVLDKLGGDTYKEQIEATIRNVKEHADDFLSVEALQIYSPKFLHVLENITDPEYQGLHLVYSQFRTLEGVELFSLTLEKNGFARFKIKKDSTGLWKIDIPEVDQGKPTYGLYTGTESKEEREIIRLIYNGEWDKIPESISVELKAKYNNNNMGEVIKVFMITSSGSEGINLRNTRYVHIMEPYWHPVRLEQVIGRARRICSHKDLPPALQTVEVFVYLMVFTESQLKSDEAIELKRKDLSKTFPRLPQTSDQYLYEISEIKAGLTSQLTDAIKESAFDCYIYSNGKCVNFGDPTNDKFAYVPDYADQQNDTTVQVNKEAIQWVGKPITLNGVKYVYRRINSKVLNIYDKASYEAALQDSSIIPLQIGTLEKNQRGEDVFKQLVV